MWEQWDPLKSPNFPKSPITPTTPTTPNFPILNHHKEEKYVILEVFTRVFDIPVAVRIGPT